MRTAKAAPQIVGKRLVGDRVVPVYYAPDARTHLGLPLPCFIVSQRRATRLLPWWARLWGWSLPDA